MRTVARRQLPRPDGRIPQLREHRRDPGGARRDPLARRSAQTLAALQRAPRSRRRALQPRRRPHRTRRRHPGRRGRRPRQGREDPPGDPGHRLRGAAERGVAGAHRPRRHRLRARRGRHRLLRAPDRRDGGPGRPRHPHPAPVLGDGDGAGARPAPRRRTPRNGGAARREHQRLRARGRELPDVRSLRAPREARALRAGRGPRVVRRRPPARGPGRGGGQLERRGRAGARARPGRPPAKRARPHLHHPPTTCPWSAPPGACATSGWRKAPPAAFSWAPGSGTT